MDADSPTDTMPMDSGMDMGPDQSNSRMDSKTILISKPAHPMRMRMQLESKAEESVHSASDGFGFGTVLDHSGNFSPCMQEPCSQVSISNSPPKVNDAHRSRLLWLSAHIASPVTASTNVHWKQPESPPIETIATDRLTTALRI